METIRIGNDIKFNVQLNELKGVQPLNIKSVKCLIINTHPTRKCHTASTQHNINYVSVPIYYAHPAICPPHPYAGFGIHPHWHNVYNIRANRIYTAPVTYQSGVNQFEVIFPAVEQFYTGVYKLTFVIKLYAPGYLHNLRTITVDYPEAFELSCESTASDDFTIDIGFNEESGSSSEGGDTDYTDEDIYNFSVMPRAILNLESELGWYKINTLDIHEQDFNYMPAVGDRGFLVADASSPNISLGTTEESHRKIVLPQGFYEEEHNYTASRYIIGDSVEIIKLDTSGVLLLVQLQTKDVSDQIEAYEQNWMVTKVNGINKPFFYPIYVHNFATDVFLGELGSKSPEEEDGATTLMFGDTIKFDVGVIREDGSRLCFCETRSCERVPAVEIYVDTPYLGIETVEDAEDDCKQYLTVTNLNTSGEDIVGKIRVVSRVASGTDEPVEKTFQLHCVTNVVSDNEEEETA